MVKVIVLDASPLGLLAAPLRIAAAATCRAWADSMLAAGHRLIVPEIADYEVRRELLRLRAGPRVARLDYLSRRMQYLALDTPMMRRAAELWADARQTRRQTAGDDTIDGDMILVAQAESIRAANVVIATSNVSHLLTFFPAELWSNIAP